jgi:hypothetical protein
VTKEEEMRVDLISKFIYKKMGYESFLCNLNNVKNPLSVKAGDIWLYVNEDKIPFFNPTPEVKDNLRQELINKNKVAKKDPKRDNTPKKDPLPPTIKKETSPNVTINEEKDVIILGKSSASERPKP